MTQRKVLTHDAKDCNVLADKGYDADDLRSDLHHKGCTNVIPGRSNRILPIEYDKDIYKVGIHCSVNSFFAKLSKAPC